MTVITLTVALLLQAQTTPYLVIPKTRPELRSSVSSTMSKSSAAVVKKSSSSSNASLMNIRQGVLDLANKERKKRGLGVLKMNPLLERAAQEHADAMTKKNFFSHVGPNGSQPEARIRAVGYFTPPCQKCAVQYAYGENIAKGQKTPKDVMTAWMKSPVHKANILKRDFKELGIGYAGGYWVQNFGGITVSK